MTLSRRFVFKTIFGGTAAVATLAVTQAKQLRAPEQKWDDVVDIIVIGGGAAGLAAISVAAQRGLKVTLFEKQPMVGGSSALCGGMIAVAGTEEQKKEGIKDSAELFVKDLITSGGGLCNQALAEAYVKEVLEQYQWLTTDLGLKPDAIVLQGGQSVPRSHHFDVSRVLMGMMKFAKEHGAVIALNSRVERLVWADDFSKIAGVLVKDKSGEKYVRARKGVLLCAGGFSRNPEMLGKYNPPLKQAAVISGAGTQGDGILMGLSVGADMLDTAYIKATYGFKLNPVSIDEMTQIYWSGAIIVNKDARRFVDESISYKKISDYALAQPEGKSWIIFDQAMLERDYKTNPQGRVLWKPVLEDGKLPAYLYRGNTIEDVARAAGLDGKALAETVKRYNGFVDLGRDTDYGRQTMASTSGKLVKIENGPFYAFPATAAMIATYCGLRIDSSCQVVDVYGDIIPGLWAAREMTGGFHGAGYISGTAFAKAQAFGRIAAKSMASQAD